MIFCWHKWKQTSLEVVFENKAPCCGKILSTRYGEVILRECTKCGKAKAWCVYTFPDKSTQVVSVEWAKSVIGIKKVS